jgi:hypothetical protein
MQNTGTIPPAPSVVRDVSISMARVNLLAVPFALLPVLLLGAPFVLLHGWPAAVAGARFFFHPAVVIPVFLGGVVVHELLHGIAWVYFGNKPRTAIRFGFKLSALTPYAHCREPLPAWAYRIGAAAPAVLLGLVPSLVATVTGAGWLLWPGLLFLAASAGDLLILWVLRGVLPQQRVQDHPDRAGCLVFDDPPQSESPV